MTLDGAGYALRVAGSGSKAMLEGRVGGAAPGPASRGSAGRLAAASSRSPTLVSVRNYAGYQRVVTGGWGSSFRTARGGAPNEIVLHVNMRDPTSALQAGGGAGAARGEPGLRGPSISARAARRCSARWPRAACPPGSRSTSWTWTAPVFTAWDRRLLLIGLVRSSAWPRRSSSPSAVTGCRRPRSCTGVPSSWLQTPSSASMPSTPGCSARRSRRCAPRCRAPRRTGRALLARG